MAFDISNPYKTAILQYAQQLMKERYANYHDTILRASSTFVTQQEALKFAKMLVEIFEAGYLKAVEDYKKQVEAHGLQIKIKAEEE